MYIVYIIYSASRNYFYVGSTQNIENRLKEHNLGKNKSTKNKGPFVVVYQEIFQTRSQAYKRELQIKKYKGGEASKRLLER